MFDKIPCAGESTSFACQCLPENYDLYERIDLTRDKEAFSSLLVCSVIMTIALPAIAAFSHPLKAAFSMPVSKVVLCLTLCALGLVLYILLHEAVHGLFIWIFTGHRPSFGFDLKHGMAYAGSTWLFKKWSYIIIALAPVLLWGVVLMAACLIADECYFWYIYVVQIFNITGAVGDIYVTCRIMLMPKHVLASDSGTAMNFYLEKA